MSSLERAGRILGEARSKMGLAHFPYESRLSMQPLIQKWMSEYQHHDIHLGLIFDRINEYISEKPSILDPYPNVSSLVEEHQPIVHLLLSSIFPFAITRTTFGYAAPPFGLNPFYITNGLQSLLSDHAVKLRFEQITEFDKVSYTVRACFIILEKYYKIPLDHLQPILFSLREDGSFMERYYKSTSMLDFLEVKVHSEAPEITSERLNLLLSNLDKPEIWLETFSPDVFYFEGFFLALMIEVTEIETLSRLRKILLTSDSFLDRATASQVANLTRIYLNLSKVEVGLFAIDCPFANSKAHRYKIHYPVIDNVMEYLLSSQEENIYGKACRENHIQIISDLSQVRNPTIIEQQLLERGFRSLMVIPLRDHKKRIIGIMELADPEPYVFTHVKKLKLEEILPLYDVAVEESRNAVENNIQRIIQKYYTNIHPSVLWKFSESAIEYLFSLDMGEEAAIMPIKFKNIYPIFGQIDINTSTFIRNKAVKDDLRKNLQLVEALLNRAYEQTNYYLLRKFIFEVSGVLSRLDGQFDINKETMVDELLVEEIHPVLQEIRTQDKSLEKEIDDYFAQLDAAKQIIYEGRKDYETSLNIINGTISKHLEKDEVKSQAVIPHYFEKSITDGVEYTIYVGQSILEKDVFSIHHLHNLRLSQLYSMVELYRILEGKREAMPIQLTVSFLVLVFSSPLDISFRLEEKHFDVDGSYNVRYEILKKRIEKACLVGSRERLTQKNKLAIVYLSERDKEEYLEYLQFLIDEDLLESEIEHVEVESVEGIQGLKALRLDFKEQG